MNSLNFAIGDADIKSTTLIKNMLQNSGSRVICEEWDGPSLLRKIRSTMPDFVIVGYNISGMKGIEIARILHNDRIAPVLLIADNSQDVLVRQIGSEHFPYIIKPFSQDQLLCTIDIVYDSFRKMVTLENEVLKLKKTLETRKVVERAKGILIDIYNMKEKDAFRYIQKRSMDECRPIAEIAKRIIDKNSNKRTGL